MNPPGVPVKLTHAGRLFLEATIAHDYPVRYLPNPERAGSESSASHATEKMLILARTMDSKFQNFEHLRVFDCCNCGYLSWFQTTQFESQYDHHSRA